MSKEFTQEAAVGIARRRSRRELITGAAAGTAGVIGAVVLTRPTTARAANGAAVILGSDTNAETSFTLITNTTSGTGALGAYATGSGTGFGGKSESGIGVYGFSSSGQGLYGQSDTGEGAYGQSGGTASSATPSRNGVHGVTDSSGDSGVWGENTGPAGSGGNGVYGSTNSTGGSGVYGHNAGTGYGVAGRAESGTGTLGDSANGTGVWANSQNATGLKATTASGTAASITSTGTALSVTGKAKFNRSGVVSIAHPAVSATVAVQDGLSSTSLVLAVMQNVVAGVWVVSAAPNTSTGKATITLNKAAASGSAKVAWFVVN